MKKYISNKKFVYSAFVVIIIIVLVIILVVLCLKNNNKPINHITVQPDSDNIKEIIPTNIQYKQIYSLTEDVSDKRNNDSIKDDQVHGMNVHDENINKIENPSINIQMSSKGPIDNMSCTKIFRDDDSDNTYLCSSQDLDIKWSTTGPIDKMNCTRIDDYHDPYSWNNNYLCVPNNSNISLSMHYNKPIPNKSCIPWIEPPDMYSDNIDKYLCVDSADYRINDL